MTGGRLAKILLAVGAPDGLTGAEAEARFATGRLRGVSAITEPLMTRLTEREHPFGLMMFGSARQLDDALARRQHERSGGRVLVNLICEPEVQARALRQLAAYERATQVPSVNPCSAVAATTRALVARRLAGQAGVRVPRCTVHRAGRLTLVEHIERKGHRYPVLLRPPGRHGSEGLVRVDGPREVARHAALLPGCTVTDFADFRSDDGLWRKHRMVYAGGRLFRRHVLAGPDWNLTRAVRAFMGERPELVAEERAWITGTPAPEDAGVEGRVLRLFAALGLDFGVIDFALPPGGELVVFEINACVQLTNRIGEGETPDRGYFEANNVEILDSLVEAICSRAVG